MDSITCPQCEKTSYSQGDIDNKYCANCSQYHKKMMFKGRFYDVAFMAGYDIRYENNVRCIKLTPKGYRVEREDKTTFIVLKDAIVDLKDKSFTVN